MSTSQPIRTPTGFVSVVADNQAHLESAVYQPLPCGCKVTGDGSMPYPLTIMPCNAHQTLAAPSSFVAFYGAVHALEALLIRKTLAEHNNRVTHAAHALGFKHHQSLVSLLDSRHKGLRDELGITKKRRGRALIQPRESKHAHVRRRTQIHAAAGKVHRIADEANYKAAQNPTSVGERAMSASREAWDETRRCPIAERPEQAQRALTASSNHDFALASVLHREAAAYHERKVNAEQRPRSEATQSRSVPAPR